VGEHEEEDHRSDDGAGAPDQRGNADARRREQSLQFAAVEVGGGEAAAGPGQGGHAGDDIGQARRPAVHGLEHLADVGAVVIGRALRRRFGVPRFRLCRRFEQVDGFLLRSVLARTGGRGRLRGVALDLVRGQRFLHGMERLFGRIRRFPRDIRHSVVASSLSRTVAAKQALCASRATSR
jgi:hypothetical protein